MWASATPSLQLAGTVSGGYPGVLLDVGSAAPRGWSTVAIARTSTDKAPQIQTRRLAPKEWDMRGQGGGRFGEARSEKKKKAGRTEDRAPTVDRDGVLACFYRGAMFRLKSRRGWATTIHSITSLTSTPSSRTHHNPSSGVRKKGWST